MEFGLSLFLSLPARPVQSDLCVSLALSVEGLRPVAHKANLGVQGTRPVAHKASSVLVVQGKGPEAIK